LPSPCDLSIENIGQLVTCETSLTNSDDAEEMSIGLVRGGALAVSGGRVVWAGPQSDLSARYAATSRIDAGGMIALPGFVDCHTHAVFAGSREREYEARLRGKTYMEIAAAGGGIRATVRAVRAASLDDLAAKGLAGVRAMAACGTTTVEIKSGYGLNLESELKMLRAIRRVGEDAPVDVVPTFLGAHEIPDEFAGRPEAYVDLVVEEMLPAVGGEHLAEFCDVFCERGVFTADKAVLILSRARDYGMRPVIHADEFADSGAARVAAEVGALSAAHLLHASDSGLKAMAEAGTVAVLLPGVALGLGRLEFADARKMLSMGLRVALATDFNPGSSIVHSLPIVASLACSFMHLTPAEAILAMTRGGARALGREDSIGGLSGGKRADLALFDVPDFRYIPYHVGGALPNMVIKDGAVIHARDREEANG
jgi:imidazolonepropionase